MPTAPSVPTSEKTTTSTTFFLPEICYCSIKSLARKNIKRPRTFCASSYENNHVLQTAAFGTRRSILTRCGWTVFTWPNLFMLSVPPLFIEQLPSTALRNSWYWWNVTHEIPGPGCSITAGTNRRNSAGPSRPVDTPPTFGGGQWGGTQWLSSIHSTTSRRTILNERS